MEKKKTSKKVDEVKCEPEQKSNVCGILGVIFSLLIPIAGLILGIIALSRKERTQALGIIAIVVSVINWLIAIALFL